MGSPRLPYTLMPLQLDGVVNFREPPQGGRGAQLRPRITLITLKCWLLN